MLTISEITAAVSSVAAKYGVKRIALFGSYATAANTPESDVDLLVEFFSEHISLIKLSSLKFELEDLLGCKVDIIRLPIPEDALIRPEKVVEVYAA